MLVQSAFMAHIIDAIADNGEIELMEFESVYKHVMDNGMSKDEIIELGNSNAFKRVKSAISAFIKKKKDASHTALLWLQYMEYDVVKEFLCAERTSNWYLHVQAVQKMMNLFAATGHMNYSRSSRMYVQEMLSLAETNPWLSEQFQEGRHAVRRSGSYWAGLWSELVIEQTLMQSLKRRGGITRGRGFEENVLHLWVSSINYTAAFHEAMTSVSGIKVGTSEQHLGMGFKRRLL